MFRLRFVLRLVVPALLAAWCLPAAVSVTVLSSPEGQEFTVDGGGCSLGGYTAPQTLTWQVGATCTVTFASPQGARRGTGYLWSGWSDGVKSNPRKIVAPSQAARYTALFAIQSLPAAAASPPDSYQVSLIALLGNASGATPINTFGQVAGTTGSYPSSAFLWTPAAPNSPVGSLIDLGGVPVGVSATSSAAALNDLGQVVGTTQPLNGIGDLLFLWSPVTANAASGSLATLGIGLQFGTTVPGFNSFGQIAELQPWEAPVIWTPQSPNSTSGSLNTDTRLNGLVGINEFGQAIMNGSPIPTLFTPSAAHGLTGTFTPVSGLPGSTSDQLVAINSGGTILGTSCVPPVSGGSCSLHTFLWTPSSLNATNGEAAEILPPAGFLSMTPIALNAAGRVVGTMKSSGGVTTPFLFMDASVYDLSSVSSQLTGGTPAGINAGGQIVVNASAFVYLLTPGAASPQPAQGTVPVTIQGQSPPQPFIVTGSGCSAGAYNGPQTLYWTPGAICTVAFVSPFSYMTGGRDVFVNWFDGPDANPRTFVAPVQATTYSANFKDQSLLSAAANPPEGGTVSGSGWYDFDTAVTVTATPANGYRMLDWTPSYLGAAGAPSTTVTMLGAQAVTANFALISATPPATYQITQVNPAVDAVASGRRPINNYGQVTGTNAFPTLKSSAFLWTPVAPNSPSGSLTQVPGWPGSTTTEANGINDRGQVVGSGYAASGANVNVQPLLWSPDAANGTAGTSVAFLGGGGTGDFLLDYDINGFGQVAARDLNPGWLWTPSSANGSSGTANNNSQFSYIAAMNAFGQAIVNGLQPALFTPGVANSTIGSFTPVSGLPGSMSTYLADINSNGAIVGSSSSYQMFLWTPRAAFSNQGTAVGVPLPAGIESMAPIAMNGLGEVVGTMARFNGVITSFLYSGGKVYDLSTVGSQTRGYPTGINDHGQIVIDSNLYDGTGGVYLLTPPPAPPPAPAGVIPASGAGLSAAWTFTFTDPRGWQDLDVVNILINDSLDGRNACYMAYSRIGILYLVNDDGSGIESTYLSNSQCKIGAVFASGSGNTLTVVVHLTLNTSFAGNKVIYMAARNIVQGNSGWRVLGTWGVPGATPGPMAAAGLVPAAGSGSGPTVFSLTFTDTKGWQDLGVVNLLINSSLDGRHACYMAYSRPYNMFYLVNDAGTALAPLPINSQCSVSGYSASGSGNMLTLIITLTFFPGFSGNQVIYLAARDNGDVNSSGWQALGSWTVP